MVDLIHIKPLARAFYNRDPRRVGRDLLGKLLIRRTGRQSIAGRIVETEAYLGADDAAAHAAAGKTARNFVLFGPPGHAYVYFIYGNHYCLNVSCLPEGEAGCILIRALEPVAGIETMQRARKLDPDASSSVSALRLVSSGPGRLAQAFAITRDRDNRKDLTSKNSDLIIACDDFAPPHLACTPRIGITKATEELLRYTIAGNAYVSGPRRLALPFARSRAAKPVV